MYREAKVLFTNISDVQESNMETAAGNFLWLFFKFFLQLRKEIDYMESVASVLHASNPSEDIAQ